MTEQIDMIRERIREIRNIEGHSENSVAEACGITVKDYTSYESGTGDIPVGVLNSIAHFFGIDLATLITGEEPRLHSATLTKKGKGLPVIRRAPFGYRNLAANFADKRAEPFLVSVRAGKDDDTCELNSHPGQEFNYVLSGRLLILVAGREYILEPGDSLYYDSSKPHGMKALDRMPAEFLAVIV